MFETADLNEPLTMVPSASADVVVASLVLHYVVDGGHSTLNCGAA